jgi:4-hydroxy-tetrahydrodipicolinate reductase
MTELALELPDATRTRALGRALARVFREGGHVLVLEGPLGAGKTSLAKAYVAAATGISEDDVTSPTFVLANEYPGDPGILHLDAYRLSGAGDLATLGYGPLERTGRTVIIEWGSRVAEGLPRDRLEVELAHAAFGRTAVLRAHGEDAARALEALGKELQQGMALKLALSGASGRMGKAVIAAALEDGSGFVLVQALARAGSPLLGSEVAPGVRLAASLDPGADVVVDFSTPDGLAQRASEAAALGMPLVGCATGLTAHEQAALDAASSRIPVLYAANTSLGVTLLERLVAQVATALGETYDAEIVELHHKRKLDAPSGTALVLAESLARATGRTVERDVVHGRRGKSARRSGEIGVHALRLGDVVGEHRVYFAGAGERLELAHVATSRETFARGALRAASWLVGKPPGRYRMSEVLGLGR